MSIDVVIPTCNNFESKNFSLYYTIRSVLAQSLQPKRIIVVENLEFEQTKRLINQDFGKLVEVIDGTKKNKNISYARNLGVQMGKSDLIIFLDDDVVIQRNHHFETIVSRMNQLDFSCGAKRYWTRTDWNTYLNKSYSITHIQNILKHKTYLPKSIERRTGSPSYHEFSFIGHCGAIKRNVFENLNGYDENFQEWSYQDTDLMMRLCAKNYQYDLMSNDNIGIYHLSHKVDKTKYQDINRELFTKKQMNLGISFKLNHFFGIFDDNSYSILN